LELPPEPEALSDPPADAPALAPPSVALPLLLAPSDLTGLASDFSGGLPSSLNFFRSDADRLSVAYQPLPLKMIPAG